MFPLEQTVIALSLFHLAGFLIKHGSLFVAAALCDIGKIITPNQYYGNLLTTASLGLMLLMPDASTDKAEGKFETAVRATVPYTEEPHLVQARETQFWAVTT